MNMKLTDTQKKMLISGTAICGVYIALFIFLYMPMHRHLASLKKEYRSIDAEIAKIKDMAGNDKAFDEVVSILKKKLDEINTRFPAKEEGILNALSERAARLGIKIDSINPSKKRIIESVGGVPIKISGCTVQEIDIQIKLHTDFNKLQDYLRSIKEDFPYYIKRETVNIVKSSDGTSPELDVELRVRSYLVVPS